MPKHSPRSFFEPWTAAKSKAHESSFRSPPYVPEELDEGDRRQILADWRAAKARAEKQADWIVWGSGMSPLGVGVGFLSGEPIVFDDQGIVTVVRNSKAWPQGGPSHEDVARRIAECVNAMAGISKPEKFLADVRALLVEIVRQENPDPGTDRLAVSLLGRCIPPEQLETQDDEFGEQEPRRASRPASQL